MRPRNLGSRVIGAGCAEQRLQVLLLRGDGDVDGFDGGPRRWTAGSAGSAGALEEEAQFLPSGHLQDGLVVGTGSAAIPDVHGAATLTVRRGAQRDERGSRRNRRNRRNNEGRPTQSSRQSIIDEVHPNRRAFLRSLSLVPFSSAITELARAQPLTAFRRGWNHPWIGYGHDFGRAWGHDGLSTSGWTCETDPSALGFTESHVTIDPQSGRGALRIRTDLIGGHANRSRGAVHLSLIDHWPFACVPPNGRTTLDLDGVIVRYRIRLPRGSAGSSGAPNTLQLLFKTRVSADRWPSMLTAPVSINSSWEERDIEVAVRVDAGSAAYMDQGFDISDVSLIGLAMTVDARAPVPIDGVIWLDEFVLETRPRCRL